jgi:hypothetical protein
MGFGIADGTHGTKDGSGHWQVEASVLFSKVGRGQVDGYGTGGIAEARVDESGLDTPAASLNGRGMPTVMKSRWAPLPHISNSTSMRRAFNDVDSGTAGSEQCHVS